MELAEILRSAFQEGRPPVSLPDRPSPAKGGLVDAALWRFLAAWQQSPAACADLAVLLRQVARWWPEGVVGPLPSAFSGWAQKVGVRSTATGQLEATPFTPAWLGESMPEGGIDGPPTKRRPDEEFPAEPYLG